MDSQTIYCNNCGNEGHLYRHCRLPVLSYGILCIDKDKVLMIQRKDSLSYIEFLRGKYDIYDSKYLVKLFNGCSLEERDNIKNLSFDELWIKLWFSLDPKKQTERMIKEYNTSKEKFNILKNNNLNELLDNCDTNYTTPEWEFPKGRRNNRETNIKCATREFEEETDLTDKEYILLDNVAPLSEEYIGSNGVRYKHIYYIAFYKGSRELKINTERYEQYTEISDIGWLSFDECFKILRNEQLTKKDVLKKLQKFNEMWSNDFNLKE
jgi:8-oxo-dGTP pyrophosphatase MutT (NUDIX family)